MVLGYSLFNSLFLRYDYIKINLSIFWYIMEILKIVSSLVIYPLERGIEKVFIFFLVLLRLFFIILHANVTRSVVISLN